MNPFYKMIFPRPNDFSGKTVVIIGAGGKTSLLDLLGRELAEFHRRILLTSLTKTEIDHSKKIYILKNLQTEGFSRLFNNNNPLYLMKSLGEGGKYDGFHSSELIPFLPECDLCLIEGDGARKLSLKAHTADDPCAPDFTNKLIIVAGADSVDTTLSGGLVHRSDLFRDRWGISNDTPLTTDLISEVLVSDQGYQQKNPARAETIYFINKADKFPLQAGELAGAVFDKSGSPVYFGSLNQRFYRRVSR